MRRLLPLAFLLLGLAFAESLGAQFPAEVRGRVTDRGSGAPVVGARVEGVGSGIETRAAPDGSFVLRGVLPGAREIRVSAFGYREEQRTVEVENGRSVSLRFELAPDPVPLQGIAVVAEREPGGATVLDRAEIRSSGARELGELLRGRAGMVVTRRGGPGSPTTVSIRGAGADGTLVLLDGVPVNDPLTGEADLSIIPLESVERVTVLRGARSARYGARALGGVIAVETRRPPGPEVAARLAAGSGRERGAALSVGGRSGAGRTVASGLLSGEWRTLDGDFLYAVPAVRGGGTLERRNAGASTRSLLATGVLEHSGTELRARAEALAIDRGMPGSVVQPSLNARQEQRRMAGGLGARGVWRGWEWRTDVDAARQRVVYSDPSPPGRAPYDDSVRVRSVGADASVGRDVGDLHLAAGVEARDLRFRSDLLDADAPSGQTLAGAWTRGEWSRALTGAWALEVLGGVRADGGTLLDGVHLSPRIGAALLDGRWTARISAGSAFSPPSLADQFFQEGVRARPNPELRPERVRAEVEGAIALRNVPLGPLRLDAEAAAFRADVDGMIVWFPDFRFVWQPRNFDVRRSGWEASTAARFPLADAEIRANLNHTRVEYEDGALTGQVVYRPAWTASAEAGWALADIRMNLSARYVGERRTVPGSASNALTPFWLTDARLSRPFALGPWRAEATLGVENLLDRDAAMLVDYPYPGRAWSIGLRVRREPRPAFPDGDLFNRRSRGETP